MENNIIKVRVSKEKLMKMLDKIKHIKIGIVGDGCLDIYWDADMRLSELSRETPHYPLPVVKERMYPGAGSNVAVNAKSLEAGDVYLLTLMAHDWRGECLKSKLNEWNINTRFSIISNNCITPTYCKPMRSGYSNIVYEDPRIDFENRIPITAEDEANIINNLYELASNVDVMAICDQFKYGIITEGIIKELEKLALKGKKIVVDSRSKIGFYKNVIIKPNEIEAMMAVYDEHILGEVNLKTIMDGAINLYERNKGPVIITMGNKGSLWYAGENFYLAEAIATKHPIDIVGAGDAFLAAFSCAYGAGFTGPESIVFGNLVSSVVIKKIGMTGTATPKEIIDQIDHSIKTGEFKTNDCNMCY